MSLMSGIKYLDCWMTFGRCWFPFTSETLAEDGSTMKRPWSQHAGWAGTAKTGGQACESIPELSEGPVRAQDAQEHRK
jgi:hypothetical protein